MRAAALLLLAAALGAGCDILEDDEEETASASAEPARGERADGPRRLADTGRAAPAPDADRRPTGLLSVRDAAPTPAPARGGLEKIGIPAIGMGNPIAAIVAAIPAGWKTKGGISWNERTPCIASGLRVEWSATSPDGTQAVELIPGFSWQLRGFANQFNACPVAPLGSAEQYLRAIAAELYRGAQVTRYVDLTAELPPATQTHQGVRNRNEAGRIELAYAGADGRQVKETLQALVNFSDAGGGTSRMGLASYVVVVRGPADRFDQGLGERTTASFVQNREWFEAVGQRGAALANARGAQQRAQIDAWHSQRMAEISAKGMADRHAIRMNTIREIGDINAAGWKSRQESLDRMHRGNVDSIREVARYADTSSGRIVELSNHYNHGFRTSSGAYVATDDPNFKPGSGGFEMNRVR